MSAVDTQNLPGPSKNVPSRFPELREHGMWALVAALLLLPCWQFLIIILDEDKSALFRGRIYKLAFQLSGRIDQEKNTSQMTLRPD
jgi:hypothetical protein